MVGQAPPRPFYEVALLQVIGHGSDANLEDMVKALTVRASSLGCDAIVRIGVDQGYSIAHGFGVLREMGGRSTRAGSCSCSCSCSWFRRAARGRACVSDAADAAVVTSRAMENGVDPGKAHGAPVTLVRAKSQLCAIALAECRICDHVLVVDVDMQGVEDSNAFGGRVTVEHGNAGALAARLETLASEGQRAALVGTAAALGTARGTLRTIAARRLPAVAHAISDRGSAEALGLAELGWGLLFASSVEDSLDTSLIGAPRGGGLRHAVLRRPRTRLRRARRAARRSYARAVRGVRRRPAVARAEEQRSGASVARERLGAGVRRARAVRARQRDARARVAHRSSPRTSSSASLRPTPRS